MFEHGLGTDQSQEQALHYYQLAAKHGNVISQYRLGKAYFYGEIGFKKNLKKAFHYFKLAADQGDKESQHAVGEFYRKGLGGIERSMQSAFKFTNWQLTKALQILNFIQPLSIKNRVFINRVNHGLKISFKKPSNITTWH